MGIFSRMTDIINSNLNALLDRAEDPEKVIRLVIQEMEDTLVEVRTGAARLIAERKRLERRRVAIGEEIDDWEAKAALAITHDREDLAVAALEEKRLAQHELETVTREHQIVIDELSGLEEDIGRLNSKLDEAKSRQKTLALQSKASQGRIRLRSGMTGGRIDRALERFEHYQQQVEQLQAKVDSYEMGRNTELRNQLKDLQIRSDVAEELEELKRKFAAPTTTAAASGQ